MMQIHFHFYASFFAFSILKKEENKKRKRKEKDKSNHSAQRIVHRKTRTLFSLQSTRNVIYIEVE